MTDSTFEKQHPRAGAGSINPGEFTAKQHSEPEVWLLHPSRRAPRVLVSETDITEGVAAVPYPDNIPQGGVVDIGLDDSSNDIFTTITFSDGRSYSYGIDGYGDPWTSDDDDDDDAAERDHIYDYLKKFREAASLADGRVHGAAHEAARHAILRALTGELPDDAQKSTWDVKRDHGYQMMRLFADTPEDEEQSAADAIADILLYMESQGHDTKALLERAREYADEDIEDEGRMTE